MNHLLALVNIDTALRHPIDSPTTQVIDERVVGFQWDADVFYADMRVGGELADGFNTRGTDEELRARRYVLTVGARAVESHLVAQTGFGALVVLVGHHFVAGAV